ncbi:hypothetical protein WJX77_000910 [Trebouxia sp. C0004]
MGVSRPQATQAGPAQWLANDLQHVRGDQQHAASSIQQSSYVPPHPHIQATQTFFDPEPAPAAAAAPAPVTQGYTVGAINTTQPLLCPAQQVHPVFLGATVGRYPILLHCGACNYQGMTAVRRARGWAHAMWAVMTFGLGYFVPVAMDTNHFCPQCGPLKLSRSRHSLADYDGLLLGRAEAVLLV